LRYATTRVRRMAKQLRIANRQTTEAARFHHWLLVDLRYARSACKEHM